MTIEEKKFFLGELKKVPDRNILKVKPSRGRILKLARRIDFKAIEEIYLKANGLQLVKKDIPTEMLFRANFFFILSLEFKEELGTLGEWGVYDVWKVEDPATFRMVERFATLLGDKDTEIYDAYFFKLDAVIQYAMSKKPDLS